MDQCLFPSLVLNDLSFPGSFLDYGSFMGKFSERGDVELFHKIIIYGSYYYKNYSILSN